MKPRPTTEVNAASAAIDGQAAQWFARMRSDRRSARDQVLFERWLAAAPEHERAYREHEQLWIELSALGRDGGVLELRRAAVTASEHAVSRYRRTSWRRVLRSVAASVAIVGFGALLTLNLLPLQHASYQTEAGDRYTVHLADGSEVTLNTDTLLQVKYSLFSRRVVLERGQAHFKVAHAVVRPFEVDAGSGVIRALGTAFDVYRHGDNVEVTLVQGQVEVASLAPPTPQPNQRQREPVQRHAVLAPGQQVSVSRRGVSATKPASIDRATAWLSGRLVFENERLGDVIREANRYSLVKMVVIDPALADVRISGVFRVGRAETFVDALRASYPIKVLASDKSLLLVPTLPPPWPVQANALQIDTP